MRPAMRTIAKLNVITLVLSAFAHIAPAAAGPVAFISSTGNDNNLANGCTAALPCATPYGAGNVVDVGGQVTCLDHAAWSSGGFTPSISMTIDCAGVYMNYLPYAAAFTFQTPGESIVIRNLTFNGERGGYPAIQVLNGHSLVLENCVFENFSVGAALDIEPNGPFNLVIRNSRISGNAAGVLLKPGSGGSVNATFDHVTIANNNGGGLKTDTTNGGVIVDITDGNISNNAGNGINAVGNAGGQNIVSIKSSVIARNGAVGIQANGVNAGVLVATSLLDQNAAGATSVVNGGNMFTYGNNNVVGATGAGFPSTAPLH